MSDKSIFSPRRIIRPVDKVAAKLIPHWFETKTSHHYIFIISQLWLTSHPRSAVILLDTGIALLSCTAQWLKHSVYNRWIASSLSHHRHRHCKFLYCHQKFLCPVEPLYFSDEKSAAVEKWYLYNDAIHQMDKVNSFPAIAFELVSSMARALGL